MARVESHAGVGDSIVLSIVPDLSGTFQYSWDFSDCQAEVSGTLTSYEVEFVATRWGPCVITLSDEDRSPPADRRTHAITVDIAETR